MDANHTPPLLPNSPNFSYVRCPSTEVYGSFSIEHTSKWSTILNWLGDKWQVGPRPDACKPCLIHIPLMCIWIYAFTISQRIFQILTGYYDRPWCLFVVCCFGLCLFCFYRCVYLTICRCVNRKCAISFKSKRFFCISKHVCVKE